MAAADHPIAVSVREKLEQAGFHFEPILPPGPLPGYNRYGVACMLGHGSDAVFEQNATQIAASFTDAVNGANGSIFHIRFQQGDEGFLFLHTTLHRWTPAAQEEEEAEASVGA
jgi:hypothetical protein